MKIPWASCLVGTFLPLLLPAGADGKTPLTGIFSNVRMSAETGDLGGLEIELHPEAKQPYALVIYCEGWCGQAYQVPVTLKRNSFALAFREHRHDGDGTSSCAEPYMVTGRLNGRHLSVRMKVGSYRANYRLRHQRQQFGLAIPATPPLPSCSSPSP